MNHFGGGIVAAFQSRRAIAAAADTTNSLGFHAGGITVAISPSEYGNADRAASTDATATPTCFQLMFFMVLVLELTKGLDNEQ